MFSFPSRHYARRIEHVGRTERLVGVLVMLLLAAIVAALIKTAVSDGESLFDVDEAAFAPEGTSNSARTSAGEHANPFPEAGAIGWRRPTNVLWYAPYDLHIKINGRADLYLQHGVSGLTFGTYTHESDADRSIDVYWYDMDEASSATSIYRAEAAPGAAPVSVGAEGYQIGGAVFFHLGASYVQALPGSVGEADAAACLEIAKQIAERIETGSSAGE
jgi:hypothetical protein